MSIQKQSNLSGHTMLGGLACIAILFGGIAVSTSCWAAAEDGGTNLANTIKTRDAKQGANGIPEPANNLEKSGMEGLITDTLESDKSGSYARLTDDACSTQGQNPYVTTCKVQ